MEHYSLKITIDDKRNNATISEEAYSDDIIDVQEQASSILNGTRNQGSSEANSDALGEIGKQKGSGAGGATKAVAAYAAAEVVKTAVNVGTKIAVNYLTTQYAYSGNSAKQNARTNTVSAGADIAGSVMDVAGMAVNGATIGANFGPWGIAIGAAVGAIAGAVVEVVEKVDGINSELLELRYRTSIWEAESRKSSERLGFEATKRNRYTYNY